MTSLPDGFVYLDEVVPHLKWDAKYSTIDNFTGDIVDGYEVNRCIGAIETAQALKNAQKLAKSQGYELFIWDCYRPTRAVECFIRWAKMPEDGKTKAAHYPNISKSDMFKKEYVCEKSGHSRGGTVDLTLVNLETGEQLEMGTGFDFMDETSHHGATNITADEAKNRLILKDIMEKSGFVAYPYEWWHYTLKDEPYLENYFNFPVK